MSETFIINRISLFLYQYMTTRKSTRTDSFLCNTINRRQDARIQSKIFRFKATRTIRIKDYSGTCCPKPWHAHRQTSVDTSLSCYCICYISLYWWSIRMSQYYSRNLFHYRRNFLQWLLRGKTNKNHIFFSGNFLYQASIRGTIFLIQGYNYPLRSTKFLTNNRQGIRIGPHPAKVYRFAQPLIKRSRFCQRRRYTQQNRSG